MKICRRVMSGDFFIPVQIIDLYLQTESYWSIFLPEIVEYIHIYKVYSGTLVDRKISYEVLLSDHCPKELMHKMAKIAKREGIL